MEKQRPHKPWCLQGAPLQKGSKEETFAALAATYGLTNEVIDLFLKGPMENLEDFRYYFADEEEIDAFVTAIWKPEATTPQEPEEEPEVASELKGDCRQLAIQISRVKRAWQATRKLSLRNENLDTVENIAYRARNHVIDPSQTPYPVRQPLSTLTPHK